MLQQKSRIDPFASAFFEFNTVLPPRSSDAASSSTLSIGQPSGNGALADDAAQVPCQICGDRGTGKHYGAHSCDGCKGFFRRTIRKGRDNVYKCRFDRNCDIDKDHRNRCRFCRFDKCLRVGMVRDSVQNERDSIAPTRRRRKTGPAGIGSKRNTQSDDEIDITDQAPLPIVTSSSTHNFSPIQVNVSSADWSSQISPGYISGKAELFASPGTSSSDGNQYMGFNEDLFPLLDQLYKCEDTTKSFRSSVITRASDQRPEETPPGTPQRQRQSLETRRGVPFVFQVATLDDIAEGMRQQLLIMVEWAKTLPLFNELTMQDQIVLLRKFSSQYLLVNTSHRSKEFIKKNQIIVNSNRVLVLSNDTCISHKTKNMHLEKYTAQITTRTFDELLRPMHELDVTENEYVVLKALMFYNPTVHDLLAHDDIATIRQRILGEFSRYLLRLHGPAESMIRMSNLLLILPPMQAIAQGMIENLHAASTFGLARIDSLIHELMLTDKKDEIDDDNQQPVAAGPPTSAGVMPYTVPTKAESTTSSSSNNID